MSFLGGYLVEFRGILSWKVKQIGILFFLKHLVYSLQVQPVVQYDVILCSMDIFVSIGSM